jgi:subtilisin family serine protease
MTRIATVITAVALAVVAFAGGAANRADAGTGGLKSYMVVFSDGNNADGQYAVGGTYAVLCTYAVGGNYAVTGQYAVGCNYAVNDTYAVYAVAQKYAVSLVQAAGGTVVSNLLKQIGVLVVQSSNGTFAQTMRQYAVVEEAAQDWGFQGIPSGVPNGGPEPSSEALESMQWSMQQIRAPQAHSIQAGSRNVDVGILDSGIDGRHREFSDSGVPGGPSNVDCIRGHDSLAVLPPGVAVGTPDPCTDNQFHGTHVAGIVAAQANNGEGIVGVAPNVTLVPVKVCDASGYCYVSSVVDGITYAGDQQLDVINMSFFVDDDEFQVSSEYKCSNDPTQRAFKKSVERAVSYARSRGVVPVAALGNEGSNLQDPPDGLGNGCDVIPAETAGVIGVSALGPQKELASYSNFGVGKNDVAAPGGNGTTGDCTTTVLSSIPGTYGCFQGTSMASPHATGVAALIVSEFGTLGSDGDVKMSPQAVESRLQQSAVDQGATGYDACFGNGRIDALRAVQGATGSSYDSSAPACTVGAG